MKSIIYLFFLGMAFNPAAIFAQNIKVITTYKSYKTTVSANKNNQMVDLSKIVPTLLFDLKYSTINNFTGVKLYPDIATTYLRKAAAAALEKVAVLLEQQGIGLKIFDAYRPYNATKIMWDIVHDERYVANPLNGSGHNKGIAVDLTLINIYSKKELDMGTGFDNFTDSAHHGFTNNFSSQIIANRFLLKTTMEKFGFKSLETEWWHYSLNSPEIYDVLDLDFIILRKKIK